MSLLSAHQDQVASRVLDQEDQKRKHLVVYLSGAHAYGFPSPDSDLDLKAVHLEPTANLLGLTVPEQHAERMEIIDGVEIDYSSNEIAPVLAGILAGNGNYLERVLGPSWVRSSPEHDSLRPIVERSLSRRCYRHYNGFARGQLRDFKTAPSPSAKKMLYVLRTMLTGTHLLRTGRLVTDLTQLWDDYGYAAATSLVAAKRAGERTVLDEATRELWLGELDRGFAALEQAHATSPLPEAATNQAEVEAWLVAVRRGQL